MLARQLRHRSHIRLLNVLHSREALLVISSTPAVNRAHRVVHVLAAHGGDALALQPLQYVVAHFRLVLV